MARLSLLRPLVGLTAAAASSGPPANPQAAKRGLVHRHPAAWCRPRRHRGGVRGRGAEISHVYSHALSGFTAQVGPYLAEQLRDGRVQRVERDGPVQASGTQTNPTWGLDRVDQHSRPLDSSYTYDHTGSSVTVYVIDTGLRATHTDFGGQVAPGYTAINDGNGTSDCHGHGTHVAGTVAGTTHGSPNPSPWSPSGSSTAPARAPCPVSSPASTGSPPTTPPAPPPPPT